MLTRIYNWLVGPKKVLFEADKAEGYQYAKAEGYQHAKAEGYRYAKHILETCPAGTEERTVDVMLTIASRDGDGYDIGVLLALRDHYKTGV